MVEAAAPLRARPDFAVVAEGLSRALDVHEPRAALDEVDALRLQRRGRLQQRSGEDGCGGWGGWSVMGAEARGVCPLDGRGITTCSAPMWSPGSVAQTASPAPVRKQARLSAAVNDAPNSANGPDMAMSSSHTASRSPADGRPEKQRAVLVLSLNSLRRKPQVWSAPT